MNDFVIYSVMLTIEEVRQSLESQGAEDIAIVDLKGRLANLKYFLIATGRSTRQIRKMSESIVSAVGCVKSDRSWFSYGC
jgi:ribosomal silencing factor RsfS